MGARMGILYEEHLLLGARFRASESTGLLAVSSYPCEGEKDLGEALVGAVVADLTGTTYLLLSGDRAPELARAALAGGPLAVGEASFEALLRGDGRVLGAPLVLRTGDHEHVLLDPTPRGEVGAAWLEYVRGAGGDEGPLAASSVEDASGMLVPLLCAGGRVRPRGLGLPAPHGGRACPARARSPRSCSTPSRPSSPGCPRPRTRPTSCSCPPRRRA